MNNSDSPPNPQLNTSVTASQNPEPQEVANLINSIENKLSMLACEDSSHHYSFSYRETKQSPQREFLTATDEGKRIKMQMNQLEVSCHQEQLSGSRLAETKVMQRINEMETYYMEKIQQLNSKVSVMEIENQQLKKKQWELQNSNNELTTLLSVRDSRQSERLNTRIQEIKNNLIAKFTTQAQTHFEEHSSEMKVVKQQLAEQKIKNKYLEDELKLIRSEKDNIECFYRNLLDDHRRMIKLDMQKERKEVSNERSSNVETAKHSFQPKSIITTKAKSKKKKTKKVSKDPQMTKQQMIPYLQQGIKELKQKLNFK